MFNISIKGHAAAILHGQEAERGGSKTIMAVASFRLGNTVIEAKAGASARARRQRRGVRKEEFASTA